MNRVGCPDEEETKGHVRVTELAVAETETFILLFITEHTSSRSDSSGSQGSLFLDRSIVVYVANCTQI